MKKPPCPFPAPPLSSALPHLLRSVTAGFSQSLAWLGWDAPSLPDAVGGNGREVIFVFFLVASGSTSVDDDDDGRAAAAAAKGEEETTLLASGFDTVRRQKGVARDATRRESAGGASEVVLGRKKRKTFVFFLSTFDFRRSWEIACGPFFFLPFARLKVGVPGCAKAFRGAPVHSRFCPLFRVSVRT